MHFQDSYVDRALRYSLGIETQSGRPYLSIPVANALADYEEYYWIDADEYARFRQADGVAAFLQACRARRNDDRLVVPPGTDRGVA